MSTAENLPHREPLPSPEKSTKPNIGFGQCLPKKVLTNEEIALWKVVRNSKTGEPLSGQNFTDKLGIELRRIASREETPLEMALDSSQEAYDKKPGKIDAVIVTTNFPTGVNLSAEIAKEFGITGFNMDVHAGCAGFGLVLHYIRRREKYFLGKRILLVDTQRIQDYLRDLRNNTGKDGKPIDKALQQTIFTDGANVMLPDYGNDFRVLFSKLHLFPKKDNEAIKMPIDRDLLRKPYLIFRAPYADSGTIEQDGPKVYDLMLSNVPRLVREDLQKTDLVIKKLDIHQASGPVVDGIIKRLPEYDIAKDCKDGNPSSGSLHKAYRKAHANNEIRAGDMRGFAVYGAGLLEVNGVVKFG